MSYSLDRLRDIFGDPLFIKQGRGILPTEGAQQIIPQVRQVLLELEGLASSKQYDQSKDTSEVSISTNVLELMPYCIAIRRAIEKTAPKITVRFLELGSRANIRQLLEAQQVNLVISIRPSELPPALQSSPLLTFDQVCFYDASVRGPVTTMEEYCAAPHATLDFGGSGKSTIDLTLDALSVSRQVKLKAPNCSALAELMKGTDCISTMQVDLKRHAMRDFAFCEPPISVPKVNFDMIWHRRSGHSGKFTWLKSLIERAVGEELKTEASQR